jgi:hypothetical protein
MDYLQKADALINKVNTHKELAALAGKSSMQLEHYQ